MAVYLANFSLRTQEFHLEITLRLHDEIFNQDWDIEFYARLSGIKFSRVTWPQCWLNPMAVSLHTSVKYNYQNAIGNLVSNVIQSNCLHLPWEFNVYMKMKQWESYLVAVLSWRNKAKGRFHFDVYELVMICAIRRLSCLALSLRWREMMQLLKNFAREFEGPVTCAISFIAIVILLNVVNPRQCIDLHFCSWFAPVRLWSSREFNIIYQDHNHEAKKRTCKKALKRYYGEYRLYKHKR